MLLKSNDKASDILLVGIENEGRKIEWLNLGYLYSYLSVNGISCDVITGHIDSLDIIKAIQENNYKVVGFSLLQNNFMQTLSLCNKIREISQTIKIVLGNSESNVYAEWILDNYKSVDIIIMGEGEISLYNVCKAIIDNKPLNDVLGIYYREKDYYIRTPPQPLIENLDELPFPNRDVVYTDNNIHHLLGSRGCDGFCSFCESDIIFRANSNRRTVRQRSVENIIDEICYFMGKNSFTYFVFEDRTFICNSENPIDRLRKIKSLLSLKKLNIQFSFYVRAEQITNEYCEALLPLKDCGLDSIFIGFESGSEEDLKLFNKIAKLSDNQKAVNIIRDYGILDGSCGISLNFGLIPFHPYSSYDSIRQTLLFLQQNELLLVNNYGEVLNKMMISGTTPITKKLRRDGLLINSNNKPILDPYSYIYINDYVDDLHNKMKYLLNKLKLDRIPNRIIQNYHQACRYSNVNYQIKKIVDNLKYINNYYITACLFILNSHENSKIEYCEIDDYICCEKEFIEKIINELIAINNRLIITLEKNNRLAYK